MGDWSFKPWGNDDAADWFQRFWKTKDVDLIVDEIEHFDPKAERYPTFTLGVTDMPGPRR